VLEYKGSYKNTPTGAPVLRELFAMEGSDSSIKLARLLGISDVWDFDQHKIEARDVDIEGLRAFFGELEFADEMLDNLATFKLLRDDGFDFYFRPIGIDRWYSLQCDRLPPTRPPWPNQISFRITNPGTPQRQNLTPPGQGARLRPAGGIRGMVDRALRRLVRRVFTYRSWRSVRSGGT